jgi:hypothetical protein
MDGFEYFRGGMKVRFSLPMLALCQQPRQRDAERRRHQRCDDGQHVPLSNN